MPLLLSLRAYQRKGRLHPITRLPVEIFELIFETVVLRHTDPGLALVHATRLAAINRTWRAIALNTPRIWSNIAFSIDVTGTQAWNAYWTCIVARVKSTPATIQISDISLESDQKDLTFLSTAKSLVIESLHLGFTHHSAVPLVTELWGGNLIAVENLFVFSLFSHRSDTGIPFTTTEPVYCGDLLKSIRFKHKFSIIGAGVHIISLADVLNIPLTSLILHSVPYVSYSQIFRAFPQLEHLGLISCSVDSRTDPVTVNQLRSLELAWVGTIDWLGIVHFPCLDTLAYMGDNLFDLEKVLTSHKTITTLTINGCGTQDMQPVSDAATQVSSLVIAYNNAPCLTSETIFPLLSSLTIIGADHLQQSEFDSLVTQRCLPQPHPESKMRIGASPIREFYIEIRSLYHKRARHRRAPSPVDSKLFACARKETELSSVDYNVRLRLYWSMPK